MEEDDLQKKKVWKLVIVVLSSDFRKLKNNILLIQQRYRYTP